MRIEAMAAHKPGAELVSLSYDSPPAVLMA